MSPARVAARHQPAARPARQAPPPHRRPLRPGALRGHRRPRPQEAHAGDLRPRQPRAAAAGLLARRLRPPRLGRRRTSARSSTTSVKQHARTPVPRGGLAPARRGHPVRAGRRSTTTTPSTCSPRRSRELDDERGTGGNHAFYLSIPPGVLRHGLPSSSSAPACPSPTATRGAGSSSRSRSATTSRRARELNDIVESGLPAGLGLPDRPLPGQGDGPEPPGAALRQPAVRAGLERQLRRPRADHHGRGHRHRRPRRLLRRHRRRARRHPEPPAAAARAHRDGGAGLLRRPGPARREGEGALAPSGCPRTSAAPPPAASTPPGWQGGEQVVGYLEEEGIAADSTHRDVRRGQARRSTPAAGPGCRSTCAPASGSASGSPRSPSCSSGRRTCRSTHTATEELGQNAIVIRVQPDEGVTMRFGSKVPGRPDGGPRRHDGLRLRPRVHRVQPRGLRAAHPRRAARRPAAVPAARGGRAVLADPRPDRGVLGQAGPARAVPRRQLGPGVGRRDDGPRRPRRGGGRDRRPAQHHDRRRSARSSSGCATTAARWPSAGCSPWSIVVDETDADEAIEAANDASRQHPCRIIVVVAGQQARREPARRPDPRRRRRRAPARSSCCASTAPLADHGDSVVIPLLLPDAPVVAWWPGERPGDVVGRPDRRDGPAPDHRRGRGTQPARGAAAARGDLRAGRHRPGLDPAHAVARPARRGARPAAVRAGHRGHRHRRPATPPRPTCSPRWLAADAALPGRPGPATPRRHAAWSACGSSARSGDIDLVRPGRRRRDPVAAGPAGAPDHAAAPRSSPSASPTSCAASTPTRSTPRRLHRGPGQGGAAAR